ncbi:MAG: hypothetical protein HY865_25185 [Chloroflexi bacterium]|nr:hypothetical protein [Chloroflexota bacterium]
MKKSIQSAFLVFVMLVVLLSGCAPASTPVPPTATPSPIPPTFTPEPTATPIPSPTPTPTLEPTAVPTMVVLPQEWNGTVEQTPKWTIGIIFLMEKMDGNAFTGRTFWTNTSGYTTILKMNGEYVTDFGDEVEQARWNNLEDYKNGDRNGAWLKWTETEVIDGYADSGLNGWFYAHIREDGDMVAVFFYNEKETVAEAAKYVFKQKVKP